MIGREWEKQELLRRYQRKKAEFIAVYGRRRVGKTYLIDKTFEGKITFRHAGLSPADNEKTGELSRQLAQFYFTMQRYHVKAGHCPTSWMEAFYMLETWLEEMDDGSRQVVFLDELPWLDTPRSHFVSALESFWNNWGCHRDNLMLIVCGSASSWMIDRLINNHGGLYNRLTCQIRLSPFNLNECEQFFEENQVRLSRYDIAQAYMILGGIPYYLDYFDPGLSLPQNIDRILFSRSAMLKDEFNRLFTSIFNNPSIMKQLSNYFAARDMPCALPNVALESFRIKSTFIPYIFTHNEVRRIFQAADAIVPPAYRPNRGKVVSLLFRMLYSCGLRVGEALNLTFQDVDMEQNVIIVKEGKGKVDRYVPMSEELSNRCRLYADDLVPTPSETDFFFSAPDGGKYSHTAVSQMWSEILRKANIPKTDNGPRIHDLRHTFCVHCLKRWVDNGENVNSLLPVLSSYLGHVHLSSVNRYLRLTADVFPNITKTVEKYLGNIVPDGGNVYEEE